MSDILKPDDSLLSVTNIVVFKEVFGCPNNDYEILKSFLSSIIGIPKEEYASFEFPDSSLIDQENLRYDIGIMDVKIKTKSGEKIKLRIQILHEEGQKNLALLNVMKMISEQPMPTYRNPLQKCISIIISTKGSFDSSKAYSNKYMLCSEKTKTIFTDKIQIYTMELEKLP
ncbi:hypothetical protein FACS189465_1200 [Clostridia bacterium]|nr:hypothetical protein FACS189465_1200 [Clostridia bacterium]